MAVPGKTIDQLDPVADGNISSASLLPLRITGATQKVTLNQLGSFLVEERTAVEFGLKGDGSDETTAMTAFFNSAIANPGVRHRLDTKTYFVTAPMPPINVANVWIEGAGATIHDVGAMMTGSVIKYTGSATASDVALVTLGDLMGGSVQQFRGNLVFRGIGLDCNSLIGIGLQVNSIRFADVDIAVANATDRSVNMFLTFVLGEARDVQFNRFRLRLRQVESPNGFCLVLGGDGVSNISFNEFWVDAQHANRQVLFAADSDNNIYHVFRAFKIPSGTTTESVALLGGVSSNATSRAERFLDFTANTPIHAYGTNEGFASPSIGHTAVLDEENGTPIPIVGTGASINYTFNTSATEEQAWLSFSPTVVATLGTITSYDNVSALYRKIGKRVDFKIQWRIVTNGTGGGALTFDLPIQLAGSFGHVWAGKERAMTGKAMAVFADGGSQAGVCQNYDGSYPGLDGGVYNVSGTYQVA
jgi:hypothetical protein